MNASGDTKQRNGNKADRASNKQHLNNTRVEGLRLRVKWRISPQKVSFWCIALQELRTGVIELDAENRFDTLGSVV